MPVMDVELYRYMRRFNLQTAARVLSELLERSDPFENLLFRLNIYFSNFCSLNKILS